MCRERVTRPCSWTWITLNDRHAGQVRPPMRGVTSCNAACMHAGCRDIPHRLNLDERPVYDAAKKKVYWREPHVHVHTPTFTYKCQSHCANHTPWRVALAPIGSNGFRIHESSTCSTLDLTTYIDPLLPVCTCLYAHAAARATWPCGVQAIGEHGVAIPCQTSSDNGQTLRVSHAS